MWKRKIGVGAAFVVLFVAVVVGSSLAVDMGIITGSDKGTYYQFGLNMQRLVGQRDIDLSVYTSKGSVENVYAVYQKPRTQLGIVQSDVLAFVARVQSDPVLKRIAKKIKMVFPLYNEEIHLLGRKDITDFDDLTDRSGSDRPGGQRNVPHRATALQAVGDRAPRDGADRHR